MSKNKINVAIVGATGVVGQEMAKILEERNFPVNSLKLLASKSSAGKKATFKNEELTIEELTANSFDNVDIALFSAGASVSSEYGPIAANKGVIVIDNSSAFRMDNNVPLVVPEVNPDLIHRAIKTGKGCIIANPNCSTIQLVVVLKPILENYGIKRVVISTYQAVSGAGKEGLDELQTQTQKTIDKEAITPKKFTHQIAFNCIPHCDTFLENDYTKEEMKLVNESRKILNFPELKITATAIRVPVFNSHSESVNIETEKAINISELKNILQNFEGLQVQDDPKSNIYPMAIHTANKDDVYVGRIRRDESIKNGINLWIVADNLRKGAALNAVQIAELSIK